MRHHNDLLSRLKANWFNHFQMQWIEDCYISIYVSRAYRYWLSITFKKSDSEILHLKGKSEEKIFTGYLHTFGPLNGKPRNMNKTGAFLIHQPISAHILIPFLLERQVRDVSVVAFLAFPFLLRSLFMWLGLWLFGWLGLVWFVSFVECTKTARVLFVKTYVLFSILCSNSWQILLFLQMWNMFGYDQI